MSESPISSRRRYYQSSLNLLRLLSPLSICLERPLIFVLLGFADEESSGPILKLGFELDFLSMRKDCFVLRNDKVLINATHAI